MENMLFGFSIALQPQNILAIIIGVVVGILAGALPGLSSATGIALLVPFTFALHPATSLILLCSLYMAAEYGGSITAICINTPGSAASAATVMDGYPMTEKGIPGKALGTSIIASTYGGLFSVIVLILFAPFLARIALKFGPAEYFALGVFGLTVIASLAAKNVIKGLIAAAFGLLLKTVGLDPFSGSPRFTFGSIELLEGFSFVPILIGLFATSEAFVMMEKTIAKAKIFSSKFGELPTIKELRNLFWVITGTSILGTVIGIIPGAGGGIACWIAYNEAKRFSPHPELFGTGIPEGVAAPEAANNASVGGALIPMLTLGIPGSPATAIMMGGLMMHGLIPGPMLFSRNADVVYGMFSSLIIACFVMLLAGLLLTKVWVKAIRMHQNFIAVTILLLSFLGAYSISYNIFDVELMFLFGLVGYIMKKFHFPVAPMVIALILGFMIETNFRRALIVSKGSYLIFFQHPISLILLIIAILSILFIIYREYYFKPSVKKEIHN